MRTRLVPALALVSSLALSAGAGSASASVSSSSSAGSGSVREAQVLSVFGATICLPDAPSTALCTVRLPAATAARTESREGTWIGRLVEGLRTGLKGDRQTASSGAPTTTTR